MQRRPSHPHGQLTGLIVLISLMLSVGIMFWLPSGAQQPAALASSAITSTPALPITRTPRPEFAPAANVQAPIDWSTIPTAIPADQLIPPEPQVVYVQLPAPPPDNSALLAAQQALADTQAQAAVDAQAAADAQQASADAALESQRQEDVRHATALAIAQQAAQPAVNPNDFAVPDPKAKCQFVGCL